MALWEVDIYPLDGQPDLLGRRVIGEAAELGLGPIQVAAARGFLLQSAPGEAELDRPAVERIARELLCDAVVERAVVGRVGDSAVVAPPAGLAQSVHVLPKPGVMDPVAQSVLSAIADLGLKAGTVRTLVKYWFAPLPEETLRILTSKVLANDAPAPPLVGPLPSPHVKIGSTNE